MPKVIRGVIGVGTGMCAWVVLSSLISPAAPSLHAQACQQANQSCSGGDNTKTSAMLVDHQTVAGVATPTFNVEPDDSENWAIVAFWEDISCSRANETATLTVTWNGSSWVTSNVNLTQDIVAISVCMDSSCTSGQTTHSWKYKLIVDLNDPDTGNLDLKEVKYETTSVDDGDTLVLCSESAAVSPVSQTFTGWDDPGGQWPSTDCTFACSQTGGSMTIGYN